MIRLLIVNDPHVSDRPPLGRQPGYTEQILAKLTEVGQIAAEFGCARVLLTGDLFHIKRPHYVSHALVGRLIRIFEGYPAAPITVLGNHDLSEAGLEGVNRQPIAVLEEAGAVQILGEQPIVADGVAFVGRPFTAQSDADPDYYALRPEDRAALVATGVSVIVAAHGSILPPGQVRPYPTVGVDFIDLSGIDLLLCGHIHENLGLHHVGNTWFANMGSLGRIARTADNMTREVVVLLVAIDESGRMAFEEVPIMSALPAAEVFIQPEEGMVDPDAFGAGDFADSIASALTMEEMPVAELLAAYAGDAPLGVRVRLEYYLSRAGL